MEPSVGHHLPGPEADAEGFTVLKSLERPASDSPPWGAVATFALGLLTFGIAPLWVWQKRFSVFIAEQQQQLIHLAEWVRLASPGPQAERLPAIAARLRPHSELWFLSLMAGLGVMVGLLLDFQSRLPMLAMPIREFREVMEGTYGYRNGPFFSLSPREARDLFLLWTGGLSLAYGLHGLRLRRHAHEVGRYVAALNSILVQERIAPVAGPGGLSGIRLSWLIGIVLATMWGLWWAVVMLLVGMWQRDYLVRAMPRLRMELARPVRQLATRRGGVLPTASAMRICRQERCRKALPPQAMFCPRCGSRAVRAVNRVA